jgi:16S rRNA processing protein RimM
MSTTVVVGRIGKAHGLKGELSVEPRTDEPDRRFADGAVLTTETPSGGPPHGPGRPKALTVTATRWHQSRLLVTFEQIADRNQADAARGLILLATIDEGESPEDPEEYYDHQLVGLEVVTTDGRNVGRLAAVIHGYAQDLLSITDEHGREVLVPFVRALVPTVDVPHGKIVVEDRPGLLAPADNEAIEDEAGGA